MSSTILRQVLEKFETADHALSLPQIARELNISLPRLEGMIQHWVRQGKIRESGAVADCGSCGARGACPFVLTLPRTFELVRDDESIMLPIAGCTHRSQESDSGSATH